MTVRDSQTIVFWRDGGGGLLSIEKVFNEARNFGNRDGFQGFEFY
jgi:hypothetical protein